MCIVIIPVGFSLVLHHQKVVCAKSSANYLGVQTTRVTLIVRLPPRLTSFWIISSQISSQNWCRPPDQESFREKIRWSTWRGHYIWHCLSLAESSPDTKSVYDLFFPKSSFAVRTHIWFVSCSFSFLIGPKFDYCPPLSQIDSLTVADERGC